MTLSKVSILVAVAVLLAIGQLLFKQSSRILVGTTGWGSISSLILDPRFILAMVLYTGATVFWIWAIRDVHLYQAYSFMALSFVLVPAMAGVFLHEPVSWRVFVGAVIIGLGIVVTQS